MVQYQALYVTIKKNQLKNFHKTIHLLSLSFPQILQFSEKKIF